MKRLPAIITFALTCHAMTAGAEEPAASDQSSPIAKEWEGIRNAARVFCTALRKERVEGLPSVEQMRTLSPLITPELVYLIGRARTFQKEQIQKFPDEKPDWIEGDLFSSSFEGVTSWELGEVFSAPTTDATAKVDQTYVEAGQKPVTWTDTLVFKQREGSLLLDDIRMGADWGFKSGPSLRGILPGGEKADQDHESLDSLWHITFVRNHDAVNRITIEPADKSAPPTNLFDGGEDSCPMPTWVVWGPECDFIAIRLGDSHRFTRTLIFRYAEKKWQPVEMPAFYPEEKKTMISNGFREHESLIDADHWQDANTLAVQYFASYTNDDDGDGYFKYMSIQIDKNGVAKVTGAVDVPGLE